MSAPFDYPAPHLRRHGPMGYADYASYRPWLRDEFSFRCVYCLLREQWGRVRGLFDLDHFLDGRRLRDPVRLALQLVQGAEGAVEILGALGDRFSRRGVFALGLAGFAVASIGCALSQ